MGVKNQHYFSRDLAELDFPDFSEPRFCADFLPWLLFPDLRRFELLPDFLRGAGEDEDPETEADESADDDDDVDGLRERRGRF